MYLRALITFFKKANLEIIGGVNSLTPSRLRLSFLCAFILLGAAANQTLAQDAPPRKDTIYIHNSVKILVFGESSGNGAAGTAEQAIDEKGANAAGIAAAPDSVKEYDLKPIFTLRSNLLLPLMNVGAQIPLGNRFSIGLDWYYPFIYRHWAPFLDQTNCFQALGPGADFRIYLGKKHRKGRENWQYRFSGHSIGIYGMYGRYDVEWQFHGEQARFLNAGVDYMYSARIGKRKRMRLDLSVGVGYFQSRAIEYQVFRPGGKAYKTGNRFVHNFIGPTKATVSLVIPIHAKIEKKEEGKR